jgi:hypothetical protein
LGLIIVALIICALIAAIFGRKAAQIAFGFFLGLGILCALPVLYLIGKAGREMGTPGGGRPTSASPSSSNVYLGFAWVPLLAANGAQYHLPAGYGAYITKVDAGSPADVAGIRPDDYISMADGQWLTTSYDIGQAENLHRPGDTMVLTVLRGGYQYNMNVKAAPNTGAL